MHICCLKCLLWHLYENSNEIFHKLKSLVKHKNYCLLLLSKLYLLSDYNLKFTEMKWLPQKIRKLLTLPTRGPHASRPDHGKLPTQKTRKLRAENAENLLIFYCEFKTVLTDHVRGKNNCKVGKLFVITKWGSSKITRWGKRNYKVRKVLQSESKKWQSGAKITNRS